MKCIKRTDGSITRLSDALAATEVTKGAKYIPKKEWKEKVRGPVNTSKNIQATSKKGTKE